MSSAAIPGTTIQRTSPRPTATGTPPNWNNNLGFHVGSNFPPEPARSRSRRVSMSTVRAEVCQASSLIWGPFVSSAAIPGTTIQRTSPRPTATGTPPNWNNNLGFHVGSNFPPEPARSRSRRVSMSTVRAEVCQASSLIWLTSMTATAQLEQAEYLTIPLNTPNFTLLSVRYWPMPSRICCSPSLPVVAHRVISLRCGTWSLWGMANIE